MAFERWEERSEMGGDGVMFWVCDFVGVSRSVGRRLFCDEGDWVRDWCVIDGER